MLRGGGPLVAQGMRVADGSQCVADAVWRVDALIVAVVQPLR
jgi:hypothetical protein